MNLERGVRALDQKVKGIKPSITLPAITEALEVVRLQSQVNELLLQRVKDLERKVGG